MSTELDSAAARSSAESEPERSDGRTLTGPGLIIRLGLSAIIFVLVLAGTFFGSDSDFPFGPFKMYSGRNDPNGTVNSLRLVGVDAHGEQFPISAGDVGLRRAELEGSLPQMKSDPALMESIAERYAANNAQAPELAELRVIKRVTTLKDGKETDEYVDEVEAVWTAP